jgi:hypothetical protein
MMASFSAYVPADRNPDRVVLVRDGFSFAALLFGPLWLIAHRLWLGLLGYVVVAAALSGLAHVLPASGGLDLLFAIWFGFEARAVRRWSLERNGYRLEGLVEAGDREAAEHRFFALWRHEPADIRPPMPASGPRVPRADVIGLFPEIGVR